MANIESMLAIALAFFIVTVSPGPANIAVATVSMRDGRRQGIWFGLGLSTGLAFWGVVAATGMGALLQSTAFALTVLKVLGGVYLLWLALQSGRSALQNSDNLPVAHDHSRHFTRGLILNLANPKAVFAWMAALATGLGRGDDTSIVVVATSICMAIGVANYTIYALAFSLNGFMAGYRHWRRWIEGIVAALFAAAGLGLLRSAASN